MTGESFVSTTIPYVNAKPHVGHALEFVEADAYTRQMAMMAKDVYFLTGSDENSLKNVLAAEKEGLTTRELVDRNVVHFERLADLLQVDYRKFIRTSSDPDHRAGATEIWERMAARDDIYPKDYEGLYCVGCEQFYSPAELVDGKCPEHLVEPELVKERNYFFRLSNYADQLLAAYESGAVRITPESRRNEVVSFVRSGLADISISRSMERARGWGIPVPGDSSQVMYVWIDALTNYINALGWARNAEDFTRYWVEAEKRVHVLGKGVVRFHAVYWPAMLMSAGLPLPTDVVVHGYITVNSQKLSKSLGNAVDPAEIVDRYNADALRYYLLAEFSPFSDGDFSEERLLARYNTDLANGLGNLVSRCTSMINRYRDGVVPADQGAGPAEADLAGQVAASTGAAWDAMARYEHRDALARIWDLVRATNAYVDIKAPWHLAKAADKGDEDAPRELDITLRHLAAAVLRLGWLVLPFVPRAGDAILAAMGEDTKRVAPDLVTTDWLAGVAGRGVTKPESLFPRLDVPA